MVQVHLAGSKPEFIWQTRFAATVLDASVPWTAKALDGLGKYLIEYETDVKNKDSDSLSTVVRSICFSMLSRQSPAWSSLCCRANVKSLIVTGKNSVLAFVQVGLLLEGSNGFVD